MNTGENYTRRGGREGRRNRGREGARVGWKEGRKEGRDSFYSTHLEAVHECTSLKELHSY